MIEKSLREYKILTGSMEASMESEKILVNQFINETKQPEEVKELDSIINLPLILYGI